MYAIRSYYASLQPLIDRLFEEENLNLKSLKAVAVSKGPGSYTGLRIGLSTAKGIAYAMGIPLIGVTTLQSAAVGAFHYAEIGKGDIV